LRCYPSNYKQNNTFNLKSRTSLQKVVKQKPEPKKVETRPRKGSKKINKADAAVKIKEEIINGMQGKKGKQIVSMDLRDLKNASTDFFIVCHADSKTHVEAIAKSIEEYVFQQIGEYPHHKEGVANAEWILLDYINAVAHIFLQEQREFYNIERLWADATIQSIASNY
jgi:ribosome-associated protein